MAEVMRNIPFGVPMIGDEEKRAVAEVLNGPILVHGPRAKQFEADFSKFTGSKHAISVSSCTAGLHLAYFYLGIKPGDEVIVPAQTHVATVHAVELCGGTPVFVDAEKDTGNMDLDRIEDAVTPRTKAISVVHFLGMPVNMERLTQIARKHGLFVVEDCALAIGTYFKGVHAGSFGDVGCFSFYPVKHMTTGEGGMILTQNEAIVAKIQRQKAFGVDRNMGERAVPGVYDVTMLGFNYRMNEIAAVMGIEQIKRLPFILQKREENYRALEAGIKEVPEVRLLKSTHGDFKSSYYCLSALLKPSLLEKRLEIVNFLRGNGVGTSVYYPRPVPHFSYYRDKYGYSETTFPVAAEISNSSISLPVGPHLNPEDMNYIVKIFKEAVFAVKNK